MKKPNLVAKVVLLGLVLSACGEDTGSEPAAEPGAALDSAGCDGAGFEAGMQTVELNFDGMERSYLLYVPEGLDSAAATPLVFNFHGLTSNAAQQLAFSELNTTADAEGFIVVYPEGLSASFNAGSCCSALASPAHMADDAGFTRAILEDLGARGCVDLRRVYSTGMSNGGYMTEYNACENADLFAAVAPVSAMGLQQTDCNPARAIPMIAFNGTEDGLVPYSGSNTSVEQWLERNGCAGEAEREMHGESYCDTWSDCDDGVEVVHCTLQDMGHCWPGGAFCPYGNTNDDVDANTAMWAFLSRFTLPE